tara:strand:+ start:209 stop:463 length:255 start_codon:yes stop_codon:yes gene_type:complete
MTVSQLESKIKFLSQQIKSSAANGLSAETVAELARESKKAKLQLRYENAKQAILEHNGSTALSTKYSEIAEFERIIRIRERLGR